MLRFFRNAFSMLPASDDMVEQLIAAKKGGDKKEFERLLNFFSNASTSTDYMREVTKKLATKLGLKEQEVKENQKGTDKTSVPQTDTTETLLAEQNQLQSILDSIALVVNIRAELGKPA